nr:hypothetical protein [Tanacetum cinerariifolium]
ESDTPKKKKVQEQINVQMAREMEEQIAREDQRIDEQIARDAEIARIHAEEELQMLIDGLDRSNEMIANHLHEYEQAAADLTIGEKIELINEMVKYQDHHAKILKYQAQQSKPLSMKEQSEFYIGKERLLEDYQAGRTYSSPPIFYGYAESARQRRSKSTMDFSKRDSKYQTGFK